LFLIKLAFLLDHSPEFKKAMMLAVVEYVVEASLFPRMKLKRLYYIGFGMVLGGQWLRSKAMLTAGKNFNHHVQRDKEEDHELVVKGVYTYLRHPSYTGFFYWGIGMQIMLGNPISFIVYFYALSQFFRYRIPEEERALIDFFGQDYIDYKQKTLVLIPLSSSDK
jgi:protein-S-isoprenylcysteine O-methyltransferase